MFIKSVIGDVLANQIDHCQCHEHLFIAKGKSFEVNEVLYMDHVEKTLEELLRYKHAGGHLVVDAQPGGCGRMAEALLEVSKKSKVTVVASTGFHKLIFYAKDHWIHSMSSEDFARMMISEVEEGMFIDSDDGIPSIRTTAKAGMIKMALDKKGLTADYRRLFDAGIKAYHAVGVPIQCHTELAEQGPVIAEYLISRGVLPEDIIIAHLDRDAGKMQEILNTASYGVFLSLDTIGRFKYHDDQKEIQLIKTLIDDGYVNQLLIGLDTTRARLKSYNGTIGLDYILRTFIPLMKDEGIEDETIKKITRINPRYALTLRKRRN